MQQERKRADHRKRIIVTPQLFADLKALAEQDNEEAKLWLELVGVYEPLPELVLANKLLD